MAKKKTVAPLPAPISYDENYGEQIASNGMSGYSNADPYAAGQLAFLNAREDAQENGLLGDDMPAGGDTINNGDGLSGFFNHMMDSADAGFFNSIGGTARFLGEFTGSQGLESFADDMEKRAAFNTPQQELTGTNWWGNAIGNVFGSGGATMLEAAAVAGAVSGVGALLPAGVAGGSAGLAAAAGGLANAGKAARILAKGVDIGKNTLAVINKTPILRTVSKTASDMWQSNYGKLLLAEVAGSPFEAMAEAGNLITQMREKGYSDEEIRNSALASAALNTGWLLVANMIEVGAEHKIAKGLMRNVAAKEAQNFVKNGAGRGFKEVGKTFVGNGIMNAASEGMEEFGQNLIGNIAEGVPLDYDEAIEAAKMGAAGGLVAGGGRAAINKATQSDDGSRHFKSAGHEFEISAPVAEKVRDYKIDGKDVSAEQFFASLGYNEEEIESNILEFGIDTQAAKAAKAQYESEQKAKQREAEEEEAPFPLALPAGKTATVQDGGEAIVDNTSTTPTAVEGDPFGSVEANVAQGEVGGTATPVTQPTPNPAPAVDPVRAFKDSLNKRLLDYKNKYKGNYASEEAQAQKVGLLANINNDIDKQVANGLFTPEEGAQHKATAQSFIDKFAPTINTPVTATPINGEPVATPAATPAATYDKDAPLRNLEIEKVKKAYAEREVIKDKLKEALKSGKYNNKDLTANQRKYITDALNSKNTVDFVDAIKKIGMTPPSTLKTIYNVAKNQRKNAVQEALKKAGITVHYKQEDILKEAQKLYPKATFGKDGLLYTDPNNANKMNKKGIIKGLAGADGKSLYLPEATLDWNAAVHEYTHLWAALVRKVNPVLWARGVKLLQSTKVWSKIEKDPAYSNLKNNNEQRKNDLIAEEVLARLAGESSKSKIAELLQEDANSSIVSQIKTWVNKVWKTVKDYFKQWSDKDLDALTLSDFVNQPMMDLFNGRNIKELMKLNPIGEATEAVANPEGNPFGGESVQPEPQSQPTPQAAPESKPTPQSTPKPTPKPKPTTVSKEEKAYQKDLKRRQDKGIRTFLVEAGDLSEPIRVDATPTKRGGYTLEVTRNKDGELIKERDSIGKAFLELNDNSLPDAISNKYTTYDDDMHWSEIMVAPVRELTVEEAARSRNENPQETRVAFESVRATGFDVISFLEKKKQTKKRPTKPSKPTQITSKEGEAVDNVLPKIDGFTSRQEGDKIYYSNGKSTYSIKESNGSYYVADATEGRQFSNVLDGVSVENTWDGVVEWINGMEDVVAGKKTAQQFNEEQAQRHRQEQPDKEANEPKSNGIFNAEKAESDLDDIFGSKDTTNNDSYTITVRPVSNPGDNIVVNNVNIFGSDDDLAKIVEKLRNKESDKPRAMAEGVEKAPFDSDLMINLLQAGGILSKKYKVGSPEWRKGFSQIFAPSNYDQYMDCVIEAINQCYKHLSNKEGERFADNLNTIQATMNFVGSRVEQGKFHSEIVAEFTNRYPKANKGFVEIAYAAVSKYPGIDIQAVATSPTLNNNNNDNIATPKGFTGEHKFLSTTDFSKLKIGSLVYNSVENFFQAMKTKDGGLRKKIASASPSEAKRMGARLTVRDDWEDIKEQVMRHALVAKFTQYPALAKKLMALEGDIVAYNSQGEREWGVVKENGQDVGENKLGKLLMSVRDELAHNNTSASPEAQSNQNVSIHKENFPKSINATNDKTTNLIAVKKTMADGEPFIQYQLEVHTQFDNSIYVVTKRDGLYYVDETVWQTDNTYGTQAKHPTKGESSQGLASWGEVEDFIKNLYTKKYVETKPATPEKVEGEKDKESEPEIKKPTGEKEDKPEKIEPKPEKDEFVAKESLNYEDTIKKFNKVPSKFGGANFNTMIVTKNKKGEVGNYLVMYNNEDASQDFVFVLQPDGTVSHLVTTLNGESKYILVKNNSFDESLLKELEDASEETTPEKPNSTSTIKPNIKETTSGEDENISFKPANDYFSSKSDMQLIPTTYDGGNGKDALLPVIARLNNSAINAYKDGINDKTNPKPKEFTAIKEGDKTSAVFPVLDNETREEDFGAIKKNIGVMVKYAQDSGIKSIAVPSLGISNANSGRVTWGEIVDAFVDAFSGTGIQLEFFGVNTRTQKQAVNTERQNTIKLGEKALERADIAQKLTKGYNDFIYMLDKEMNQYYFENLKDIIGSINSVIKNNEEIPKLINNVLGKYKYTKNESYSPENAERYVKMIKEVYNTLNKDGVKIEGFKTFKDPSLTLVDPSTIAGENGKAKPFKYTEHPNQIIAEAKNAIENPIAMDRLGIDKETKKAIISTDQKRLNLKWMFSKDAQMTELLKNASDEKIDTFYDGLVAQSYYQVGRAEIADEDGVFHSRFAINGQPIALFNTNPADFEGNQQQVTNSVIKLVYENFGDTPIGKYAEEYLQKLKGKNDFVDLREVIAYSKRDPDDQRPNNKPPKKKEEEPQITAEQQAMLDAMDGKEALAHNIDYSLLQFIKKGYKYARSTREQINTTLQVALENGIIEETEIPQYKKWAESVIAAGESELEFKVTETTKRILAKVSETIDKEIDLKKYWQPKPEKVGDPFGATISSNPVKAANYENIKNIISKALDIKGGGHKRRAKYFSDHPERKKIVIDVVAFKGIITQRPLTTGSQNMAYAVRYTSPTEGEQFIPLRSGQDVELEAIKAAYEYINKEPIGIVDYSSTLTEAQQTVFNLLSDQSVHNKTRSEGIKHFEQHPEDAALAIALAQDENADFYYSSRDSKFYRQTGMDYPLPVSKNVLTIVEMIRGKKIEERERYIKGIPSPDKELPIIRQSNGTFCKWHQRWFARAVKTLGYKIQAVQQVLTLNINGKPLNAVVREMAEKDAPYVNKDIESHTNMWDDVDLFEYGLDDDQHDIAYDYYEQLVKHYRHWLRPAVEQGAKPRPAPTYEQLLQRIKKAVQHKNPDVTEWELKEIFRRLQYKFNGISSSEDSGPNLYGRVNKSNDTNRELNDIREWMYNIENVLGPQDASEEEIKQIYFVYHDADNPIGRLEMPKQEELIKELNKLRNGGEENAILDNAGADVQGAATSAAGDKLGVVHPNGTGGNEGGSAQTSGISEMPTNDNNNSTLEGNEDLLPDGSVFGGEESFGASAEDISDDEFEYYNSSDPFGANGDNPYGDWGGEFDTFGGEGFDDFAQSGQGNAPTTGGLLERVPAVEGHTALTEDLIDGLRGDNERGGSLTDSQYKSVYEHRLASIKQMFPFLKDYLYQPEAVASLETRLFNSNWRGALNAQQAGNGKTVTILAALMRMMATGPKNILIVAPNENIIQQWVDEANTKFGMNYKNGCFRNGRITWDNAPDREYETQAMPRAGRINMITYQSFRLSQTLTEINWDVIVFDESHKIASGQDVTEKNPTSTITKLRALSGHETAAEAWAELIDENLNGFEEYNKKAKNTKVIFVSATPFAYLQNTCYAEGFLFKYSDFFANAKSRSVAAEAFMKNTLSLKEGRGFMGKTIVEKTNPESVQVELALRSKLVSEGAMFAQGRPLKVDYNRKFVKIATEKTRILEKLYQKMRSGFGDLFAEMSKHELSYIQMARVYESEKCMAVIEDINDYIFNHHHKVILFHDTKKESKIINPFAMTEKQWNKKHEPEMYATYQKFVTENKALIDTLDLEHMDDVPTILKKAFGQDVLLVQGKEKSKNWRKNRNKVDKSVLNISIFNRTNTPGYNPQTDTPKGRKDKTAGYLIACTNDKASEGLNLQDASKGGKYPIVEIHIGLAIDSGQMIQVEARPIRADSTSNVAIRYYTTGSIIENSAYHSIAFRNSSVEAFSKGDERRDFKRDFLYNYDVVAEGENTLNRVDVEATGGRANDLGIRPEIPHSSVDASETIDVEAESKEIKYRIECPYGAFGYFEDGAYVAMDDKADQTMYRLYNNDDLRNALDLLGIYYGEIDDAIRSGDAKTDPAIQLLQRWKWDKKFTMEESVPRALVEDGDVIEEVELNNDLIERGKNVVTTSAGGTDWIRGIVNNPIGYLKQLAKKLYIDWVDKNHIFKDIDNKLEQVFGRALREAERVYHKMHGINHTAAGMAEGLLAGTEEDFDVMNSKLKNVKMAHKNGLMTSVMSHIQGNKLDNQSKEFLRKYGLKNSIEGLSRALTWRRLREIYNIYEERGVLNPEITEGLSRGELDALIKTIPKQFNDACKDYYALNDNILSILEDAGVISEKLHELCREHKNYCPLQRDFADTAGLEEYLQTLNAGGSGAANVTNMIKELSKTGSDRKIINPLETTINVIHMATRRAERNKAGQYLVSLTELKDENGKRLMDDVVRPSWHWAEKGEKGGIKVEKDGKVVGMLINNKARMEDSTFTVMKDGVAYTYWCDPMYYRALTGYTAEQNGIIWNFMKMFAQLLRWGATKSGSFIVRNGIRDTLVAPINSDVGFKPFIDTYDGMRMLYGKDLTEQDKHILALFRTSGVSSSGRLTDGHAIYKSLQEMVGDNSIDFTNVESFLNSIGNQPGLKQYNRFNEIVEQGTRLGIFKKTYLQNKAKIGKGEFESELEVVEEATRQALHGTTDFGRSGEKGQKVNQIIPFFNATIQGVDIFANLLSNPKTRNRALFFIGQYLVMPSLAIWAMNHDKDWWKEADPQIKYSNWLIDEHLRIPVPQEAGVMFGGGLMAFLDAALQKDPKAVSEWAKAMRGNLFPNHIPTMISPIIEWQTNYSFFRQKPVVSKRLQQLPDGMQYTSGTSDLSRIIGGATNVSPVKIDNTVQGYLGTLGMFAWRAIGLPFGETDTSPSKKISELPFVRDFNVTSSIRTRYSNDFYELRDAVTKEHNAHGKKGSPSRDVQMINAASRVAGNLLKDIRAIEADKKISKERKRQLVDQKRVALNNVYKKAVDAYGAKYL